MHNSKLPIYTRDYLWKDNWCSWNKINLHTNQRNYRKFINILWTPYKKSLLYYWNHLRYFHFREVLEATIVNLHWYEKVNICSVLSCFYFHFFMLKNRFPMNFPQLFLNFFDISPNNLMSTQSCGYSRSHKVLQFAW